MIPQWISLPRELALNPGEAHVWMATLDAAARDIDRYSQSLAPNERARSERFVFESDRDRYIVGRGILRAILGRYLKLDPHAVPIGYGNHGKPELAGGQLRFNLAHSEDLALYAFTLGTELGVDVERIRGDVAVALIADQFFAPGECAALSSLPEAEQVAAFFRCWTRKEAFVKANGLGLAFGLDEFEVSLKPDEPAALLSIRGDDAVSSRWTMHSFVPAPGFVAAIAAEARLSSFSYFSAR